MAPSPCAHVILMCGCRGKTHSINLIGYISVTVALGIKTAVQGFQNATTQYIMKKNIVVIKEKKPRLIISDDRTVRKAMSFRYPAMVVQQLRQLSSAVKLSH